MTYHEHELLPYRVGGLLYTPALQTDIAEKIERGRYPGLTSMAFCLEDSIQDEALEQAEGELVATLCAIRAKCGALPKLPLLFVRVRTPEHLAHMHDLLGHAEEALTGYILPKFDLSNGEAYANIIRRINIGRRAHISIMPILESKVISDIGGRARALLECREILDGVREDVLNIRVGGNDFCNLYGLRRAVHQSIYEIGVIRDILSEIVNVFSQDYVVSGPVWEYFGEDRDGPWAKGLARELELDRLNGFVGKTAIHPAQLPVIYHSMKVRREDYADAVEILGWQGGGLAVSKSADGSRMNEVKCHARWARRIHILGQLYGIRED